MKTESAEILIDAPPTTVWAVLTDLSRYPEWNPLFREAAGEIAVGNRLTLKSFPPEGRPMTVRPKIIVVEPGACSVRPQHAGLSVSVAPARRVG